MDLDEIAIIHHVIRDLEEAEDEDNEIYVPRPRFFTQINAFENFSSTKFLKNFRVTKVVARELIGIIRPFLHEGRRTTDLSIETKVLVALNFYGQGGYQETTGSNISLAISQPSVSRSVHEITMALNRPEILNRFVHFPQNVQELEAIRLRFFRKYNLPGIVGIVDGTHVAIVRPNENEHIYVNRKGYHSLNVQLVCDENLKILSVNARFPGASHDAHVWRQSAVSNVMQTIHYNIQQPFFLLGDSGYPLRAWLMIPLDNNPLPGTPEYRFQNAFKSIRSLIERCNGKLKNRFRCLLKHRVLHYTPEFAGKIVNACVVLHNICTDRNVPEPVDIDIVDIDYGMYAADAMVENEQDPLNNINVDLAAGRRLRAQIIARHFN